MKKIFCLIFTLLMFAPLCSFSSPVTSENAFEIPIMDVPPGGGDSKHSGGLSGGAVTAIALGSVFGGLAAAGGIGWYFAKHNPKLISGYASGCKCPYSTIRINDCGIIEKLKEEPIKNKYLLKAFEKINIDNSTTKRYLLIQDTHITNKTYNTVYFELPEFEKTSDINVKIIQVSNPFNLQTKIPALNSKIMLNPADKNTQEMPTIVSENDSKNGILIKKGHLKGQEGKTAAIVTEYNSDTKASDIQNYALLIEFDY